MSGHPEPWPVTEPALSAEPALVRFAPDADGGVPKERAWLTAWLRTVGARDVETLDDLAAVLRRSRPLAVLIDAQRDPTAAAAACTRCKSDPYSALIPCIAVARDSAGSAEVARLLRAGADEVIAVDAAEDEAAARIDAALRRSRRDLAAQPTSGLPGPPAIELVLEAHLKAEIPFAACYADLDHFKEYNDRYGFREGDRVIRMVARLLDDTALGVAGVDAFVGHIGGDDFLCVLPLATAADACALMVETFDLLAPLQYNAADQRAGYYLGKDRRGQLHRVPLMTLSIGIATTERRHFASAADVSRLASEMKSFAKTLPGSVFAFDRRGDDLAPSPVPPADPE